MIPGRRQARNAEDAAHEGSGKVATELIINPTNPREIHNAVLVVRALAKPKVEGKREPLVRVTIKQLCKRTNEQNALYWVSVCEPFADYLEAEGYGPEYGDLKEYAHQRLSDELLRVPDIHPKTGEVLGHRTRSTTELSKAEFSQHIEHCVRWILQNTGCRDRRMPGCENVEREMVTA